MLNYLTKEQFFEKSGAIPGGHWNKDNMELRWRYHGQAIEIAKTLGIDSPERVLEIGTMGISLVNDSHTLDYAEKWNFPGKHPTYLHDARQIPWPIPDKSYDLVVALRVFQHLTPVQQACFLEAKRVAKRVLLVCPETYERQQNPCSRGISANEFLQWNEGVPPTTHQHTEMGTLYFWNENALPSESRRMIRIKYRIVYALCKTKVWAKKKARRFLNLLRRRNG